MEKRIVATDLPLHFAPEDFVWQGEHAPRLPIICHRDGAVHEPFLRFFGWSLRTKRCKVSSMRDEAYVLREWLAYMEQQNHRWDDPDDQLLVAWREEQRQRREMEERTQRRLDLADRQRLHEPDEARVARKLEIVFTFYSKLSAVYPNRLDYRALVGPKGRITTKRVVSPKGDFDRVVWSGAGKVSTGFRKRVTPNEDDVRRVLAHLRTASENEDVADRDWLIGRCMSEAGLRRAEIADLTVESLLVALRKASIPIPSPRTPDEIASAASQGFDTALMGLDAIIGWEAAQRGVLAALDRLEERHRRRLGVSIIGKGGKTREAPFPIRLIRDILSHGVWGVRRKQIEAWREKEPSYRPPGEIFLSWKTHSGITPGAIGDMMKSACAECDLNDASGHRLRAYFGTTYTVEVYGETLATNGYIMDQRVDNVVLDRVANAMGHARVTTTVRSYLDFAQLEFLGRPTKAKAGDLRLAFSTISSRQRALEKEQIQLITEVAAAALPQGAVRLVREIVKVLAAGADDFAGFLSHVLNDPKMNPLLDRPKEPEPKKADRPSVRLVT